MCLYVYESHSAQIVMRGIGMVGLFRYIPHRIILITAFFFVWASGVRPRLVHALYPDYSAQRHSTSGETVVRLLGKSPQRLRGAPHSRQEEEHACPQGTVYFDFLIHSLFFRNSSVNLLFYIFIFLVLVIECCCMTFSSCPRRRRPSESRGKLKDL